MQTKINEAFEQPDVDETESGRSSSISDSRTDHSSSISEHSDIISSPTPTPTLRKKVPFNRKKESNLSIRIMEKKKPNLLQKA